MAHHQELSMQQRASPFVYWRYGLASQSDGSQCLHYNTVKDEMYLLDLLHLHIYIYINMWSHFWKLIIQNFPLQ